MKKYAILTYWAKGMSNGSAPLETSGARLNEGKLNSSHKAQDGTYADFIRNEDGSIKRFMSQVDALNYCIGLGWTLDQTLFESYDSIHDSYRSYIFILSKSL